MFSNKITLEIPTSAQDWPEEYQVLIAFLRKLRVDYKIDKEMCINLFKADVKMILDTADVNIAIKLNKLSTSSITWKIGDLSREHVGFWLIDNSHSNPKTKVDIVKPRCVAIWSYLLGLSNHNLISEQDRILHEMPKGYRNPIDKSLNHVFKYTGKEYAAGRP